LLHIFGEGLGTELQSFCHGEVREKLIRQFLDGHAVANGQYRGLDYLAAFGHQHLGAKQPAGLFLRHQLDEAAGIKIDQGPGDVFQIQRTAVHVQPLIIGLLLVQSDRCDLWVGEYHCRHGG
jgi:hypothetical protein